MASFRQQLARREGFVVALWAPDAAVPCVTETRECGLALTVSAAAAAPRHAARVKMISMVDRMLRAALPQLRCAECEPGPGPRTASVAAPR